MRVLCLGLSHNTASLDLRERLCYSPEALTAALARFGCGREACPPGLSELAILSTCNRLEVYAAAADNDDAAHFEALLALVAETRSVPAGAIAAGCYRLSGPAAVRHAARVAAGLDSLVLGEPQILGQVSQAYQAAAAQGAAGPVLGALFRAAIRAGKRARSETSIGRNAATISSLAVRLATGTVADLSAAHVVVLGAGEMGALAVEALRQRGVRHVAVVNRTQARALAMAERWGARTYTFEQLGEALTAADIVIGSTDAPHHVVSVALARQALAARPQRPLVFIDIAVPRDIDPEAAHLPGVRYYDLDHMQAGLENSLAERREAIPQVEAIVAEETAAFEAWLHGLAVAPLLADLRRQAEAIRRQEVARTLRRLPHLSEAERAQVEALADALINKLLHEPTTRLKAAAANGQSAHFAAAVRHLFGLHEQA